jgi:4-amino-4-deoxy-L-arabinose transferase-like glycosyltransferase
MPQSKTGLLKIDIAVLAIIFVVGIFLRLPWDNFSDGTPLHALASIHPQVAYTDLGFDEGLYRDYLRTLIDGGLGAYPQIVEHYIEMQGARERSILPPLRFLYLFCGYSWHELFGSDPRDALRDVSAFATVLALLVATVFVWRLVGARWAVATAALMSVAPTQLHMSQHGLIDGFFGFLALLCLWLFWETLQAPSNRRLLALYTTALALLALTKENAFFVWVALIVLITGNRWLKFGTVTRQLVLATLAGPLVGIAVLALVAGGIGNLVGSYLLFMNKAPQYAYAILTGDGPWYRYLVDLLLVSPIVLILAVATVFRLDRTMKPEIFFTIFIAASYLVMCNVKYGMNLRYANMWDLPLRFLAVSCLMSLVRPLGKYQNVLFGIAITAICAIEFRDYIILAVQFPLYELVPEALLRALHILK